ncbi:hypothetical protein BDZ45DRAFT_809303 [Acephala macrosclerotiorum]|nr:hypothetical protein BDZ45DRAFT_809303 [Acephala macrosclerotiorum]
MDGRSHEAIEDWFNYQGRTFDVNCYKTYTKEHKTWEIESSTKEIEHQLSHPKSEGECEHCRSWPVPEEPKRSDFFPEELSTWLLSEVLARVAGVSHIDGLPIGRESH